MFGGVQRWLLLFFTLFHSGTRKDGARVVGSRAWFVALQGDRHLHLEEPRWSVPVIRWSYCHDTEHVLLSLQKNLWGLHQHLGEQAQNDSSTPTHTQLLNHLRFCVLYRYYSVLRCAIALLCYLQDVLEEWLTCQRSWLYLEPIFSSDDINKQLPVEGKRYQQMEQTWRRVMKSAIDKRKVGASTTLQFEVQRLCFNAEISKELESEVSHLFVVNCKWVFLHLSLGDWAVFRPSSTWQTERVQCPLGTGAEGSQWVLGDKTRFLPQVSVTEYALQPLGSQFLMLITDGVNNRLIHLLIPYTTPCRKYTLMALFLMIPPPHQEWVTKETCFGCYILEKLWY